MKKVIKFEVDDSVIEMRITDNGFDEQWLEGYLEMNREFLGRYFTVTEWKEVVR